MRKQKLITELRADKIDFREVDVCNQMLENLLIIAEGLIGMHKIADRGMLYAKSCHHDNIITRAAKVINQECFYGRSLGFQVGSQESFSKSSISLFF